jgi:uncharacterized membrane protein YcaP (DUF421 family)
MRRELLTDEELGAQLRQQGVEDVEDAKAVYMEGDGSFSVITGDRHKAREKKAI